MTPRLDMFRYLAPLPEGYDDRTRMALSPDNRVVITHPEMPVMVLDEQKGEFVPVTLKD